MQLKRFLKTTDMDKRKKLAELADRIKRCARCKKDMIGKMVFGEGDPDARVMFVGEAPGKTEAKTGRPFVGRSGRLLRQMIVTLGLREERVYITSPIKYLPKHKTPKLSDIVHARPYFKKQIEIINPKIIVLLGNTASHAVLGEKVPILKMHATSVKRGGRTYFLTLHPAAALRFKKFRLILREDFRRLKDILDA